MKAKIIKTIIITTAITCCAIILIGLTFSFFESQVLKSHGNVEATFSPDGTESLLLYHENTYYSTHSWLTSSIIESDIEIGYSYAFCFPSFYYYTDNTENPLYILSKGSGDTTRNVYIRNDYNFKKQTFIIDNTDIEFIFEKHLTKSEKNITPKDYISGINMFFTLKDIPRLNIHVSLYQEEGNWFFIKDGECWLLSNDLISMLKNSSLL